MIDRRPSILTFTIGVLLLLAALALIRLSHYSGTTLLGDYATSSAGVKAEYLGPLDGHPGQSVFRTDRLLMLPSPSFEVSPGQTVLLLDERPVSLYESALGAPVVLIARSNLTYFLGLLFGGTLLVLSGYFLTAALALGKGSSVATLLRDRPRPRPTRAQFFEDWSMSLLVTVLFSTLVSLSTPYFFMQPISSALLVWAAVTIATFGFETLLYFQGEYWTQSLDLHLPLRMLGSVPASALDYSSREPSVLFERLERSGLDLETLETLAPDFEGSVKDLLTAARELGPQRP